MANMIARLGVLLGLDSAEFTKGIETAGKKLETFSKDVEKYGKVGAVALTALTYKAMAYADSIADVAKANDVSIDSILKLSNALGAAGGKADDAGKLLASFTNFVDTAAKGSGDAQKAFSKVGVSLDGISKLSTQDLFTKAVQGIAQIEDPLTRNAAAMDMFGKAAKGVDFVALADGMKNNAGATDEQAKALKDAADAFDTLEQFGRDVLLLMVSEIGPMLKTTASYLKDMTSDVSIMGAAFKTVFQTIAVLGSDVEFIFKGIAREIAHTIENAKVLATQGIDAAIKLNQSYDAQTTADRAALDAYQAKIMGTAPNTRGSGFDDPRKFKSDGPARKVVGDLEQTRKAQAMLDKERRDREKEADDAEREFIRLVKEQMSLEQKGQEVLNDDLNDGVKATGQMMDNYVKANEQMMIAQEIQSRELDRAQELFRLEQYGVNLRAEDLQLQRDILNARNKYDDAVRAITDNEAMAWKDKEAAMEREFELMNKTVDLAQKRADIVKAAREGTFEGGFIAQMDKALRDMPTNLDMGKQAFDSVFQSMNSAIDDFSRNGKRSFKDFARSVIQDMIAIQLKAQATNLLGMFTSALFGNTITSSGVSAGGSFRPSMGYANGGEPPVGVASMVGERGPEMFVPKTAGTIIPNHALAGAMGGTTVNYNGPFIQSMSAIDTQSGVAFLAKNKQAVFASYQSANRSIPMSR